MPDPVDVLADPLLGELDDVLRLAAECIAAALDAHADNVALTHALLSYRMATARCRADIRKAIA